MNYYHNMQLAIDYIEDHLKEHITLEDVAKSSNYSVAHIYRIFSAMTGYSVMSYVRKRRLSNALYDLVTTSKSVTEIAFEYGYESHEVFTRTFKKAYGQPPRKMRKALVEPILFEKINLLSTTHKGDKILKAEIICKDSMTLLCIKKHILGPEAEKNSLIQETRKEAKDAVQGLSNRLNENYYAAYDYIVSDLEKDDDDLDYYYYYGIEVSDSKNVPDGMVTKVIPKGKYAVFNYDVKNNTLNDLKLEMSVYDYIDGVWLPESGFKLSDESDYEVIDIEQQVIEYYISVE